MAGRLVLDGEGLAQLGGALTRHTDAISSSALSAEYALAAAADAVVSPRLVPAIAAFAAQITRQPAAIGDYVASLRDAGNAIAAALGGADASLAASAAALGAS